MPSADQILFLNVTNVTAATSSIHASTYAISSATSVLANISGTLSTIAVNDLSTDTPHTFNAKECSTPPKVFYPSNFGVEFAIPEWEAILTTIVLSVIIVLTIVGNILVILSVFTYKPLRIVQNFFIVSLAVADLTVALLVLPLNVAFSILGRWEFGIHLCKMWLTCDVMCCTSSILNLCAIALDRYWAITDPINYAQKRTVGRVLLLIAGVWILSLLISSPPLVGWNDWPEEFTSDTPCELTTNRGYVIYSSLGSFVIPLAIMTIVYIEIYIATRRRLRERAKASKINTIASKACETETAVSGAMTTGKARLLSSFCSGILCCGKESTNSATTMIQNDQDSISSETHINNETPIQHHEHRVVVAIAVSHRKKTRRAKIKDSIKHGKSRGKRQHRTIAQELDSPQIKDGTTAEQLLLSLNADNKKTVENTEISTGSRNGQTICIQTATAGDNEDENVSLKITPPQSSAGATSSLAVPLQKKPSGVYQFIEEKQKISLSKERRAARTLGIIMGVFVICWLPFFLMYVIIPFCDSCCPTKKFINFITWLGYINSGLNPVIYTIFNLDYRRAFKRLLGFN